MGKATTTQILTTIKEWVLGKMDDIRALIPSQASTSNQLADKAFVNSSIATETATFRGTYNVVTDLSLAYNATHSLIASALATKMTTLSIVPNNNDYAFVQIPTSDATPTEIAKVEKYKYNGSVWGFEYELNNSGFTAAQWAAINSGATLELIGKLSALPTNAQLTELLNGKVSLVDNGAYDVTAHNSGATFASLFALLSSQDLSTLIPVSVRKGGMSIKFVLTSDNKYVQYRYMGTATTGSPNPFLDTSNWSLYEDTILIENPEFIKAWCDSKGHFLFGIRIDGSVDWQVGVPFPVKSYVDACVKEILNGNEGDSIDGLNKIITFLDSFSTSDTLATLLNTKVDKMVGKSLIDQDVADRMYYAENPEYLKVFLDEDGKVLGGRFKTGVLFENVGIITKELQSDKVKTNQLELSEEGIDALKEALEIAADNNILTQNPAVNLLPKLYNLKKGYYYQDTPKTNPLVLLHFTDLHLYNKGIDTIKLFQEEYSDFIDDVIHTGDFYDMGIVPNQLSSWDNTWLNVIGNHDAVTYDTTYHFVTPKVSYDTLFAPFISNWDVYQPDGAETNGYCYYYKDYSDKKIRLIVLDCNNPDAEADTKHWTNTQKTWFEGVLAETLDSNNSVYGFHVVVAVHYPPFVVGQDDSNPFQDMDYFNSRSGSRPMLTPCPSEIPNVIKTFKTNGGKFACWICGHTHFEFMGFNENYTGQLCICIPNMRPTEAQSSARIVDTKTEYCFNMMAVDSITSTVKVLRIGSDTDRYLRKKEAFSYDYESNKIIVIN